MTRWNAALATDLASLGLGGVTSFDDYGLIADMIINPAKYGFSHTLPTDTCIDIPACAYNLAVARQYVFWDDAHKTTRVHELLADAIVAELPEPATACLLLTPLAGLALARCHRTAPPNRGATSQIANAPPVPGSGSAS